MIQGRGSLQGPGCQRASSVWPLEADSWSPPLARLARGVGGWGGDSLSVCVSERPAGVLIGGWVQGYWLPCSEMEVRGAGTDWGIAKDQLLCFAISYHPVSTISSESKGIHGACTDYTVGLY